MDAKSSKELSIEQLRLLGEAIDSSPSPLTLYNEKFELIYANGTSRELWPELHDAFSKGLGLHKAAHEASLVLFPGAPPEVIKAATAYAISTFESSEPAEMMASEGRWIELTHHQIAGRAIAGMGTEITDFKKREKDLKLAKKTQENLIEVLEYGLLVVDDDGVVKLFNSAYENYCRSFKIGIRQGMSIRQHIKDFFDAENFALPGVDFDSWFEQVYAEKFGNDDMWKEEFHLSDGRHILRHQHYRKHVGNIVTITDITEIKNAQLKAESAERSKSEFLANMSHEIRTPMNGVMGMAHLLSRCNLDEREQGFVEIIQRSSQALMTIINDILDFSKIEAGRVRLDYAPFDLRDCIEDVVALLAVTAEEKGVDLIFNMQPDLPQTYIGDVGRLRQIITNLFGNAVKFTPEGHVSIDVQGEQVGGMSKLVITIKDTGIGIPADKIDNIFDKFQQADTSATRQYEGTGLGLSIARRLVNLMGGDITAKSELDKGSCFTIVLSLASAPDAAMFEFSSTSFSGSKVLIIDDEPARRKALAEQFSKWNCKTVPVNSSKQAALALEIACQKKIHFDAIILNKNLSTENVETFISAVKSQLGFRSLPVLIPASGKMIDLQLRLEKEDLKACFIRSYDEAELRPTIESLLNQKPAAENNIISLTSPVLPKIKSGAVDVLVADDNELNCQYFEHALQELGVSFKIVDNGQDAIEQFTALSPSLILMDVTMPVLNGYQATQEIRVIEQADGLTPTPILALTARAMEGDQDRCLNAGMDGYLVKPLSVDDLERTLRQWGVIDTELVEKEALA